MPMNSPQVILISLERFVEKYVVWPNKLSIGESFDADP
jgi:hypothetical protein